MTALLLVALLEVSAALPTQAQQSGGAGTETTPTQPRLAPVVINEVFSSAKLKRVGFESRLKTSKNSPDFPCLSIGMAFIEKRNPMSLTHLLEGQGGRVRNCVDALVYIDGSPPLDLPDKNANAGPFTKNSSLRSSARSENNNSMEYRALEFIPVKQVEGMEIYTSISEIPAEYRPGGNIQVNGRCVILLWTRER